ncbi:hypothetical protein CJO78_01290 [Ralstonia solanacearum]|nr:hypothetical protein LBM2029_01240 [Ralstonia solanacearum]AXV85043.1 hypothetical protein CJO78_01290 [Ralstonia solanacearum]AXW04534.1 hypothetical protein CJO82_00945 [Ralstonia solanacearum]AXW79246.1 hypothetical protein CJO98_01310 [Ralstonia solanacearum]
MMGVCEHKGGIAMTDRTVAAPSVEGGGRLERILKQVSEGVKTTGSALVLIYVVMAFAMPQTAAGVLSKLRIEEFDAGWLKVKIAQDTADAQKEAWRAGLAIDQARKNVETGHPEKAIEALKAAQKVVGAQQGRYFTGIAAILSAKKSSAEPKALSGELRPPSTGWLRVGYFGDDGKVRRLDDSIAADTGGFIRYRGTGAPELRFSVSKVVLARPASVVSDGDNCTVPDVGDADLTQIEPPIAVVSAEPEAIPVSKTIACHAPGNGYDVYVKVDLPAQRIVRSRYVVQ